MFQIEHANKSLKFLKEADNNLRMRVIKKIEMLRTDPVPHDAKKMGRKNDPYCKYRQKIQSLRLK